MFTSRLISDYCTSEKITGQCSSIQAVELSTCSYIDSYCLAMIINSGERKYSRDLVTIQYIIIAMYEIWY